VANFLQQVYGIVALLHSRLPESAVQEHDFINKLRVHAKSCGCLVDNVQDYLAPQAMSREPVILSDLCTGLTEEFKARFPDVEWDLVADSSLLVQGDRDALIACGRQLMTNAVQAGASHVEVQLRLEGESRVRWDILDDGSGIDEPDPAKLFEPFTGQRPDQAGLGLAIVARAVAAMNGEVTLSNRQRGGAQAVVWLPRGDASGRVV
jgi:signal transduction histidine kinase